MIKRFFFLLFLFFQTILWAFQWPIAGGFLTASFGENNLDSFLKGIRISGHGSVVSPFLEGELIYYADESDPLVPVMGNTRVLHHENGFRSIYGHLESSYGEPDKIYLDESDQLGIVGNSGRSYEKSLFLMIYDTEMNQYVNPQIILPPSGDEAAPEIAEVILKLNGETINLKSKNRLSAGRAEVYGEIIDSVGLSHSSIKTVPYSISMFYLGNEINQIKFDTLKEERGELVLMGGNPVTFGDLYRDDLIFLGEISLIKGIAYLEITATDNSENSTIRTFQLTIE